MNKVCTQCKEDLPLKGFNKSKKASDGHRSECRDCQKIKHDKYYAENADICKRATARWIERNRDKKREYDKTYRDRYLEKVKAGEKMKSAIRNGSLKRMPCEVCGAEPAQGHHEDYSKPLDVVWLCSQHHADRHKKLREMGIDL